MLVSDWIQPYINKASQHSYPHQFRITKDQQGKAIMHTKKWSSSPEWQATTGEEFLIKAHPEGVPEIVEPKCEELCLRNLRRDLPKYQPYLTREDMEEWGELLDSLEANGGELK